LITCNDSEERRLKNGKFPGKVFIISYSNNGAISVGLCEVLGFHLGVDEVF
jgi:hypothetical protein